MSHLHCAISARAGRVSPPQRIAALGLLAAGLLAAATSASAVMPRTTLPVIERQVMCVTCKIPLNLAQSHQADRERAFIQGLIDQGQTEAQVKRSLVAQYGPTVLALPSTHGFDLAAYLVPILVLLALLVTVAVLLPSWRRHARAGAAAHAEPALPEPASPLSRTDAARLEADLANFD